MATQVFLSYYKEGENLDERPLEEQETSVPLTSSGSYSVMGGKSESQLGID